MREIQQTPRGNVLTWTDPSGRPHRTFLACCRTLPEAAAHFRQQVDALQARLDEIGEPQTAGGARHCRTLVDLMATARLRLRAVEDAQRALSRVEAVDA